MLTLGYAIAIRGSIRVGKNLFKRLGARKLMIWGSPIVGLSMALLMSTNVLLGAYQMLAVVSYTVFGLGLAFYATPSTDVAIFESTRPPGVGIGHLQNGLDAGRIFRCNNLSGDLHGPEWRRWVHELAQRVLTFAGWHDNVAVRRAAMVALRFNLLMVAAPILAIMLRIRNHRGRGSR